MGVGAGPGPIRGPGRQGRANALPRNAAGYNRAQAGRDRGRGGPFFEAEVRYRRPDGETRWMLIRAAIMREARRAFGVLLDINERKQSEERLKLLAREVDHRANNMLAVVQSTIQLSKGATA